MVLPLDLSVPVLKSTLFNLLFQSYFKLSGGFNFCFVVVDLVGAIFSLFIHYMKLTNKHVWLLLGFFFVCLFKYS